MAAFLWAPVAVRAPDGWLDLGVLIRKGRELRWQIVDNVRPEVALSIQTMVDQANHAGTVAHVWDYLLERGGGGLTSVGRPQRLEAPGWDAAIQRALGAQHQHVTPE